MNFKTILLGLSVGVVAASVGYITSCSVSKSNKLSFNNDVRPILNKNCMSCHGGVKKAGGLSILFREEALGVTESGKPSIIPGDSKNSEFIKRLTHHDPEMRMPYKKEPLKPEEIEILKKWIDQGAEWEDHWSLVVPKLPYVPKGTSWCKNEIDNFAFAKMKEVGLEPNPEADPTTLIRRVSLDLVGLPPTQEDIDTFIKNPTDAQYAKYVDKLLASPHFGERWAVMWLDLARYADSKGFEKDVPRTMWPYRDYVINAFNKDKPYDVFTTEQLAGDLLPNPSKEQLLATAFHRNTLTNDEGGTDDEEFRTYAVLDRLNTTFDTWQGITIGCVQCHSHPYDPIRHEEYYKLMSFLNNTADADRQDDSPKIYVGSMVNNDYSKYESIINQIEKMRGKKIVDDNDDIKTKASKILYPKLEAELSDIAAGVTDIRPDKIIVNYVEHGSYFKYSNIDLSDVYAFSVNYESMNGNHSIVEMHIDAIDGPILGVCKVENTQFKYFTTTKTDIKSTKGKHDVYFVFKFNTDDPRFKNNIYSPGNPDWFELHHRTQKFAKQSKEEKKLVLALNKFVEMQPQVPIFQDLPQSSKRKTHVFIRGNFMSKGDEVQTGVPGTFNTFKTEWPTNRLGLAKWLTSEENPLTARVAVNRFWEQIFGMGIVETLEDFGTQGAKPSHPELLDWLAITYRNNLKWSTKKLLKMYVTSATYRQSSSFSKEKLEKDPKNMYLSRASRIRLNSEQLRDQSLAVSGLLSRKMGGPCVMPYQPDGVWQTVYSDFKWETSKGEDRYRRGIYTFWRRSSPYPSMLTFDNPERNVCSNRRLKTNTPLQALVMLNDTVYIEAAQKLAQKAISKDNIELSIRTCYKKALGKEPSKKSLDALLALYLKTEKFYFNNPDKAKAMCGKNIADIPHATLTVVAQTIMNTDEFVVRN